MIRRLRRLAAAALDRRFDALGARIDSLEAQLAALGTEQARAAEATRAVHEGVHETVAPILRTLAADDAGHRRRLHELRAEPEYGAAWDDPEPLVTISISTRDRPRPFAERALPSALGQTHGHVEVLVVGDAAGPETAAAVKAVGDARVRFVDLTQRWTRPHANRHWLTASTLTRNEAYRLARGRWLVDLDDDDALMPGAVEQLLERARAERLEVVYGVLDQHDPDGGTTLLGGVSTRVGAVRLARRDRARRTAALRARHVAADPRGFPATGSAWSGCSAPASASATYPR